MLVDLFGKKNADEGAVKVLMDATFDGRKAEFRADDGPCIKELVDKRCPFLTIPIHVMFS